MNKINRALYGPSLTEVILGATLSVALGVALGVLHLMLTPVVTVKQIPKDAVAHAVYYIPGTRGGTSASLVDTKRKAFIAGGSVTVSEDELNILVSSMPAAAPAKPKAAAPGSKAAALATAGFFAPGAPNFRLRGGEMQVAVPVKLSAFGLEHTVHAQTRGTFVKHDESFVFDPTKLWIGACPVDRLPGMTRFVTRKILLARPVPTDIALAWDKLADVAIVGSSLKLTMP